MLLSIYSKDSRFFGLSTYTQSFGLETSTCLRSHVKYPFLWMFLFSSFYQDIWFFKGSLSNVFKRILRQFKRLYVNYFLISVTVLVLIAVSRYLLGQPLSGLRIRLFNIVSVNAVFPEFKGFEWNIWFLKTYLALIIVVPIFAIWRESLLRNAVVTLFSFFAFILANAYGLGSLLIGLPVFVPFYGIFFFLGSTLRMIEKQITLRKLLIFLAFVLLFVGIVFFRDNCSLVVQRHKFPPSLPYFFYSLPYLWVFIFFKCFHSNAFSRIPAVLVNFLQWSSREVFNIYLIQSFVCSIPFYFIPLIKDAVPFYILYLITLTFNLSFTICGVWLYGRFTMLFVPSTNKIKQEMKYCA